jgi:oligopeptide transport system substrate-binding protein
MSGRRWYPRTLALLVAAALAAGSPGFISSAATSQLAPPSGQVIRVANQEPLNLDPGRNWSGPDVRVSLSLFDPLVAFDSTGKIHAMAARSWDVSADGTTYTFHLRPGMKWSDGHPVTALDFEYGWKRVADPKFASDYASAVYIIKGAENYNKGKTTTPDGIAVKALDDLTLRVTLVEPAAYFLRLVSTWTYMPIPRWQVEKYGAKWVDAGNMVTNGPFKMETWDHDQRMVLVADPLYYGTKPTLRRINFVETDDPARTSVSAYENNELDISDAVASSDIDRLRNDPAYGKELHKFRWSGTAMMFIDVSNTDSPLSKVKVRQALYLAIDHNKIAHNVLRDTADPGPTIMPVGILGRLAQSPLAGGVSRAQQLLAEAGYPNGQGFPGFKLVWGRTVPFDLTVQALQQIWHDELKTNVTLQRMESKQFNAAFNGWATQHYDAYIRTWSSDFEDPFNWDNTLFDSQADWFHTHWANAQFDTLVRQAAREADMTKRRQMYEEANTILETDLPAIPLYHLVRWMLVKPYVQNFDIPGPGLGNFWVFREAKILQH